MDFLVSYTGEDRDWAEWIGSHLGALGYSYALDDPARPGEDPLAAVQAALAGGQDAIVILSGVFVEAVQSSGASYGDRLVGPGRPVAVQIEPLTPPPGLRDVPTARMHEAADDYGTSRDLLISAVRAVLPRPAAGAGSGHRRVGLPAPTALAEAYPVAAPPPSPWDAPIDQRPDGVQLAPAAQVGGAPAAAVEAAVAAAPRSAGLLGADRHDQPGEAAAAEPPGFGDRAAAAEADDRPGDTGDDIGDDVNDGDGIGDGDDRLVHLPQPRPALLWGRDEQLAALVAGLTARLGNEVDRTGGGGRSSVSVPAGRADDAARRPVGITTRPQLDSAAIVLVGPSGLGKSALVAELANRQAGQVDVAWWFRGATRAMVGADARALAAALGAEGLGGPEAVAHVREWMQHTEQRWLIVVDGVVDWNDVADLVPPEGLGQLLVTTSNPALDAGAGATALELPALDDTTATAFLLARTSRSDQTGARRVAERLGGSPAALELAACYALASGESFETYLAALDADDAERQHPDVSPPVTTVEAAVVAARRAADRSHPEASALLPDLAAATADAPIPRDVVDAVSGGSDRGTVEVLASWGLVLGRGPWVVVPPAIRQALAYLVPGAPGAEASARLADALADAAGAPDSLSADAVLPHVARLVGSTPRPAASPALARAAALTTVWAERQGAVDEAVALGERSLDLHRRTAGERGAALGEARRALGELYVRQGDHPRALPLLEAALADAEADVAAGGRTDDSEIDRLRAAVAQLHRDLGDETGAARLDGDQEGPAGPDAPTAVSPADGTAPTERSGAAEVTVRDMAGDGDAALDALAAELARVEAVAGPTSVEAISARHRLALAHGEAGAHTEAVALLEAVVAGCETHFGPDHLDTMTARSNLASAHAEAGDHAAAIACQERVVADRERMLGPDDALTLMARSNLANEYAVAGRYDDAMAQQQRVVADYLRTQGPAHGATLAAQHNLANTYADVGRHEEALELRLQVLERRLEALGPEHPQTLGARNNLANSYADLGRHEEALELRAEVLAQRQRLLGPEHPQVLGARNNLANSYADVGRHDEALALRLEVLGERERLLGPDHPHTLTARNNLANSYAALGRHDEALELRRRALSDCERVLGPDHPHTLTARENLAGTHTALDEERKAADSRAAPTDDPEPLPPPPPIPSSLAVPTEGLAPTSRRPGSANGAVAEDDRGGGSVMGRPGARGRKRRFWFWRH